MKSIYFTVGPTQLYPTFKKHIQIALKENVASKSHRGKWFQDIFISTTEKLRTLLNIPLGHHIFFCSSGTEVMERSIQNLVEKTSFHVITGAFSKRWTTIAKEMGKEPTVDELLNNVLSPVILNGSEGSHSPRPQNDKEKLQFTIPADSELICFTQNETSTGIAINPSLIAQTKKENPDKLVAVDVVSSAPYVNLDYKNIDCAFFSVQKLFGLPAGLGIIVISPQAMEKSKNLFKKGVSIGSFHNFPTLLKYAQKQETPETPPVFLIYLLEKVISDMLDTGIETIRKQTSGKAALLYNFFDNHPAWKPFVTRKDFRSPTTLAINFKGQADGVKKKLQEKGLIVGSGYGEYKGQHLRIANFPAHTKKDIKKLIIALEKI